MKKVLFVSMPLFMALGMLAQPGKKGNPPAAPKTNNPHLAVFSQAMNSGDFSTGVLALNYYIAEQKDNTPYADTLAMLYMQLGAYPQCYYWADRQLKVKPDDNGLMEMKAICLDKMQQPKEAIDLFEKLFRKTQSPYHGYKLMELQYGIKRLAECLATANATEKLPFKPEMVMTYNMGDQVGRTYLQAGVFNIHGLALYELDKKPEAKQYFEKAVALDSNFALARQNLQAMNVTETAKPGTVVPNGPAPVNNPANKQK